MSHIQAPPQRKRVLGYINAHGLTASKYNTLRQKLIQDQWDALVIAETWWIPGSFDWDPWVAATSVLPPIRATGHQNHGMLLVVPPGSRAEVYALDTTQYSISFRFFGSTVKAVYLPPSLDSQAVSSTLLRAPVPHFTMGDFNIRLGQLTSDHTLSEPERIHAVFAATDRHNLLLQPASLGRPRTDHIFASPLAVTEWGYYPSPVPSDHGLMLAELPTRTDPQGSEAGSSPEAQTLPEGWWTALAPAGDSKRLLLSDLQRPEVCQKLEATYLTKRAVLQQLLLQSDARQHSRQWELDMADALGQELQSVIISTGKASLGHYSVSRVKRGRMPELLAPPSDDLDDPVTQGRAIRAFKRSRRGLQTTLTSPNPALSPLQAAHQRFQQTLGTTQAPATEDPIASTTFGR